MPSNRKHSIMNADVMVAELPRNGNGRAKAAWAEFAVVSKGDKEARRERRRLGKHQEDQVRLIDGWEQYRALWDGIDFKRQIINMGDKKVRFALVIMGALNAILLLVLTRGPVLRALPPSARVALIILLVIYGLVTFGFVIHTIEALRPRPEARVTDNDQWLAREGVGVAANGAPPPMGLMIHGNDLHRSFDEERRLWSKARISEINAELILFNRSSSMVLTRQMKELGKVYHGLKVLTVLAALILGLLVGSTLMFPGAGA
jgi:hypothetical protein